MIQIVTQSACALCEILLIRLLGLPSPDIKKLPLVRVRVHPFKVLRDCCRSTEADLSVPRAVLRPYCLKVLQQLQTEGP